MLGGFETFGDRDVVSKVIKLNDNKIFSSLQSKYDTYQYINLANYKVTCNITFVNWDEGKFLLKILPTTNNNPLDMILSNTVDNICDSSRGIRYYQQEFSYSGLFDNNKYANISFQMPTTPSRRNNNFGLKDFVFSVSTCHKSCKTCSSPSYDGCRTCKDQNTTIISGQCECNSNFLRDLFNPDYPCVPIVSKNIISNGLINKEDLGDGSVLSHRIGMSSKYCKGERRLVGGYIDSNFNEHYIDIITSEMGINFYMKKIEIELVTEEDNSLIYPFTIKYNTNTIPIEEFYTRKIKYLKFKDELAIKGTDCYSDVKYKSYLIVFYTYDRALLTDVAIVNNFNHFWGILKFSVNYFKCHTNCNTCIGYRTDQCLSCKPGLVLNMVTYNKTNKTSSCICDESNGYYQTSETFDPLVCTSRSSPQFDQLILGELDNIEFKPELWTSYYKQMSNSDVQVCETKKILGQYDALGQLYLEKNFNLTQDIPHFKYSKLNFEFQFYLYKTLTNYAIKIFFDDQYVWGEYYNLGRLVDGPSDETLICDSSGKTKFYRKLIKFDYFENDYFKGVINPNPKIRIKVYPDSECLYDSDCGWGISDFKVKVVREMPDVVENCAYRPYSKEPCTNSTQTRQCYPGYYESKFTFNEFSCQGKLNLFLFSLFRVSNRLPSVLFSY